MTQGHLGAEAAVVSVAAREPIDVAEAPAAAHDIDADEDLARELVRIAIDADETTIVPLLGAVERIENPLWRARTLFSQLRQTPRLTKTLPEAARARLVSVVAGLGDETARVTA